MRRIILELFYFIKYFNYFKVKKDIFKQKTINERKKQQFIDLKKMLNYAAENIPFYQNYFEENNFKVEKVKSIDDLSKLPIITKNIIRNNFEAFQSNKPRKFKISSTGGSTGTSLKYLLDYETSLYGRIINNRGWSYAGYKPGDKVLIFGGGSLVGKLNFSKKIKYMILNHSPFSSYGINEKTMFDLYKYINKKHPKFMYGYTSSIYFFALFIKNNNLKIKAPIKGVFCTAEKMFENQRQIISDYIGEVFDVYGLNDGGISAYECKYHNGLHIDFERSILQVVDNEGRAIKEGTGRIIATDLKNFKMPLIRYDSGDLGTITTKPCECGLDSPRLLEIIGRSTDYLKINNTYIGSPVLTVLMGKFDFKLYQIIQESEFRIIFKVVSNNNEKSYIETAKKYIIKSMKDKVPEATIDVIFYDDVSKLEIINKHKFIINKTLLTNNDK